MRFLRYFSGILAGLSLLTALLLLTVHITVFHNRSFYPEQYEKEHVLEAVGMNMDDLMDVTDGMLSYLDGDREDLVISTTMFGKEQEFFNDREKAHMADVKKLNLGSILVMKLCFLASFLLILFLFCLCRYDKGLKRDYRRTGNPIHTLSRSFAASTILFISSIAIGALIASTDFDHYWRLFHEVFFDNDLWLLSYDTDMLIRIVPLNFFIALVSSCAIRFGIIVLILLVLSIYSICKEKRRNRKRNRRKSYALILLLLCMVFRPESVLADESKTREEIEAFINSIPADTDQWPKAPDISSKAAILIEKNTGTILYSKNALETEYPASTTKLMTALLTLEYGNLSDTVTFSKSAIYALTPGASHIGMKVGERLSVKDCLYGLLLPSANEVANALAEYISGSMKDFVAQMNQKASELGCLNTHFENPNGLHSDEHYTCAYDLALILEACIETPEFIDIDSQVTYVIKSTNLVNESRPMKTTHLMLRPDNSYYREDVICGKTGHTDEAGGCLTTYAKKGSMDLICVVLGGNNPEQYDDTSHLLDYGFQNFSLQSFSGSLDNLFSSSGSLPDFISSASPKLLELKNEVSLVLPVNDSFSELETSYEYNADSLPSSISLSLKGYPLAKAELTAKDLQEFSTEGCLLPISSVQGIKTRQPLYFYFLAAAAILFAVIIICFLIIRFSRSPRKKEATHYKNLYFVKKKFK